MRVFFIVLISIVFLAESDSVSIKALEEMLKNKKKTAIDTSNIKINLSKGMDPQNFIPKDPFKNRLSDFVIGSEQQHA